MDPTGFEALYSNDPDNDYALTLHIFFEDQTFIYVRKIRDGPTTVTVFPKSKPLELPLDWLLEKLEDARETLSKPGTQ